MKGCEARALPSLRHALPLLSPSTSGTKASPIPCELPPSDSVNFLLHAVLLGVSEVGIMAGKLGSRVWLGKIRSVFEGREADAQDRLLHGVIFAQLMQELW